MSEKWTSLPERELLLRGSNYEMDAAWRNARLVRVCIGFGLNDMACGGCRVTTQPWGCLMGTRLLRTCCAKWRHVSTG